MMLRIFKSPTKLDYSCLTGDDETSSLTDYLPEDVKEGRKDSSLRWRGL